jgi:hypothetical protein
MMELRVEKIATFDFRHDYFVESGFDWSASWPDTYPKIDVPAVAPTVETQQKLRNLGLYFRKSNRGFHLFAQVVEETGVFLTERKPKTNQVLLFFLTAPHPHWNQYTGGGENNEGLTVFSNLTGLKSTDAEGTLYVHDEIENAAPGDFEPGALVRDSNHVYEALKKTNTQPPGADWTDLGTHTNFSLLTNKVGINRGKLEVEDASLASAVVTVKDVYGTLVWSYSFDSGSTEKKRAFDISHLAEGLYSWQLNAVEQNSFLICSKEPVNAFGLLMLYVQPVPTEIPAPQRLAEEWLPIANGTESLDANEINPRQYVIHFLPKRAKWKYIFSRDLEIPSEDVPTTYEKLSNTSYQSKSPIAITKLETGPDFGLDQRLPAASAGIRLPQYSGNAVESYVKEIYVNV